MTSTTSTIREQVMAQIIDVMKAAQDQGRDKFRAAEVAFPGTPNGVLCEALATLGLQEDEEWWRQVERTIDGEIIRQALLSVGDGGNADG